MITIRTDHPLAFDSPDHLYPTGTRNDNSTSAGYIEEIEHYFGGRKLNVLDLGCSGGQLVVDMHNCGHKAVGLEGSDYSVVHKRANWPEHHNKILFTCDITKPFEVLEDGIPMKFDVVSMWEVMEHIAPKDITQVLENVSLHLKDDGLFLVSIAKFSSRSEEGVELHQSILPERVWRKKYFAPYFTWEPYPFKNHVREDVWSTGFSRFILSRKQIHDTQRRPAFSGLIGILRRWRSGNTEQTTR